MIKIIRIVAIILFSLITIVLIFIYIHLELFYYSDFACGCSSGGHGFYLTPVSKIIGYIILVLSYTLLFCAIFRIFNISILMAIPAILFLIITIYGNGFMLYSTGPCGFSINERTAYIFTTHIADIFRSDLYNISDIKSINDGEILGFYLNNSTLHIYRINANPIKIQTSFLLWHIDKKNIKDYFTSFNRVYINEIDAKTIELVGGKDMPMSAFSEEINQINGIYEQNIFNESNGTTRLILRKN